MSKELPKLLRTYKDSGFVIQEKSRLIYYLCVIALTAIFLLLAFQLFSHPLSEFLYRSTLTTSGSLLILFVLLLVCLFLLSKGHYILSSHLLAIFVMLITWLIMMLGGDKFLAQLNYIIIGLMILSMLPLIMAKHRYSVALYSVFNIFMLFIFLTYSADNYDLVQSSKWNYLISVSVAFVLVALLGMGICFINKKAFEKAESDLVGIKKVGDDIKQSNELFKTLFESMPISMSLADMNAKLIMVNKAFCKDLGIKPEDAVGKTTADLGVAMTPEHEQKFVEKLKKDGFVDNLEVSVVDKYGARHELYFYATVLTINNQKAVLSSNIDVTEKRQLEFKLKEYNTKLEELVKERTEDLEASNEELKATNEEIIEKSKIIGSKNYELSEALELLKTTQQKLIQTEKMASLGLLTAGVAHEVNNPLNYIMGAYSALENYFQEHGSNEAAKTDILLNSIAVGIERISNIIKGLNQFSRQNDSMDEACDLHAIIDNCIVILHNKLKHKVDIIKKYFNEPIILRCYISQLHQVFVNIIVNAIQAIPDKGTIEIFTNVEGERLIIEISDDGVGIEENLLANIADPFFTTKAPGEGTGLGLSITQTIINDHNGEMKFESKINKGTKVTLSFPYK